MPREKSFLTWRRRNTEVSGFTEADHDTHDHSAVPGIPEPDLTGYATEGYVDDAVGGIATGLTQAYVGYNAIGAVSGAVTTLDTNVQKITLANDCLLTDIEVYIKQSSGGAANPLIIGAELYDDVGGKPVHIIAGLLPQGNGSFNMYRVAATPGDARWLAFSIGRWLTAGDYWIGFTIYSDASKHDFFWDTTGTGYKWNKGGNGWMTDAPDTSGTVYLLSPVSRSYSLRANTVR